MTRHVVTLALLLASPLAFAQDQGKALYTANCMACHGAKGDGNGPAAIALDPKPRSFSDAAFWEGKTNEDIKKVIKTGKPGTAMAPFPQLSDADVAALTTYLRTFEPKP
ncbi:MAG: cytochrome c [Alphaproteobacteria bacterium]|nr:cytochrome c [Alphaproteobacteria bacterium]